MPSRIMLTTESWPSKAFPLWQTSHDNPYVLGDLTWTAMDYLGESGIGAWQYGTPQQAMMAERMSGAMSSTGMIDQMFTGMVNGKDVMAEMAHNNSDPNAKAMMEVFFHPWHAAACGELDLTGFRKPQSYYRDIVWNGGDRVYATVRLPEPEGKKIFAMSGPTIPSSPPGPGLERKAKSWKWRSILWVHDWIPFGLLNDVAAVHSHDTQPRSDRIPAGFNVPCIHGADHTQCLQMLAASTKLEWLASLDRQLNSDFCLLAQALIL